MNMPIENQMFFCDPVGVVIVESGFYRPVMPSASMNNDSYPDLQTCDPFGIKNLWLIFKSTDLWSLRDQLVYCS